VLVFERDCLSVGQEVCMYEHNSPANSGSKISERGRAEEINSTEWQRSEGCLKLQVSFCKEPLIIGLFCEI